MGFLERHIQESNSRRHMKAVLEFIRQTYGDIRKGDCSPDTMRCLNEDFMDSMDASDIIAGDEREEVETERKATLVMSVSTGAKFRTDDIGACRIWPVVRKIIRFSQTSMFIGDDAKLNVKIYAQHKLFDHLGTPNKIDFDSFGEVVPLTMDNTETCLKDETEDVKKADRLHNGLTFWARIRFNPHRVTFSRLNMEVGAFSDILEDAMLELDQLADVTQANMSYQLNGGKNDDAKEFIQLYTQQGRDGKMPVSPNYMITERDVLKMGKYFFSNDSDIVWDSDRNNEMHDNVRPIFANYMTVQRWLAQMVTKMMRDDVFKWQIIGMNQDERTDVMIAVKIMNVSQKRKNTVNEVRKHFSEVLNSLTRKNKFIMKNDMHELYVFFIYEGSSNYRERLPKSGKYNGDIEFDTLNVHYFIMDDSNSYRVFRDDKHNDVKKDGFKVFMRKVNDCLRFQPVELMAKEEQRRNERKEN